MLVLQRYEFGREFGNSSAIIAGVSFSFTRTKSKRFVFRDKWERRAYGLSDQIRAVSEEFFSHHGIRGVEVTLNEFRFSDVNLTDEAVEIAVRGCLIAAIEHFPSDVFKATDNKCVRSSDPH